MKIVFLDAKTIGDDVSLDAFTEFGEFVTYPTTSKKQTLEHIGDAQIVLTNKVVIDKDVMDECPNLKLICIVATGMNNVDLDYAASKGIEVKNAAGYSTASVTQLTFTLALYLIAQSRFYDDFVKSSGWANSGLFTNVERPFWELKDKKWGIIGFGTIGKNVAKVADAFGANVSYYSTSGANNDSSHTRMELDEMLKTCDVISIHAPLNEKTNGLIKKPQLDLMKKGAVLLNLGRGGIVDESDLADAIDNNGLLAGIDVVATEPINIDNKLLHVKNKDNLAMTPHIAWASVEARVELMKIVAQNIKSFLESK
ncbi:D-2-hydroxyacid dehydrogenase [Sulfurospirillum arcachonense]|uniref:D-2-hydroxyacid dehydrogenase n=1 Tax=Sulfurospirillum arcachonense TaxID=57666 RepID=UPI0004687E23|nr:D-2-hydroxyacid dehydrogenase [Sulfurospirillum arcachonense]